MKAKSLRDFSNSELLDKAHEALQNALRDALHASIQLHSAEALVMLASGRTASAPSDTMESAAEQLMSATRNLNLAQSAWAILIQKQKESK